MVLMKEIIERTQRSNARCLVKSVFWAFFHVHESTDVLGESGHTADEDHVWNTCPNWRRGGGAT